MWDVGKKWRDDHICSNIVIYPIYNIQGQGIFHPFLQLFCFDFSSPPLALSVWQPFSLLSELMRPTYTSRALISNYESLRRYRTFHPWSKFHSYYLNTLGLTCIHSGDDSDLPLSSCSCLKVESLCFLGFFTNAEL